LKTGFKAPFGKFSQQRSNGAARMQSAPRR
jgi:hypothetical protein